MTGVTRTEYDEFRIISKAPGARVFNLFVTRKLSVTRLGGVERVA